MQDQQQQQERPPPYPQEHSHPDFPAVPRSSLSNNDPNSPRHLPALEPVLSHDSQPGPDNPMDTRRRSDAGHHDVQYSSGITLQPLRFPQVPEHGPGTLQSPGALAFVMRSPRENTSSTEELDDRVAAEALLGLGKISQPTHARPLHHHTHPQQTHHHTHSQHSRSHSHSQSTGLGTDLKYYDIVENVRSGPDRDEPEPLLSLLTSSHPWLGGTINSSVSAYSSTKQYTPRFVQRGADLVENTVGAVGRRTGVEGGIRRYLGSRRPSELDVSALAAARHTKEEPHPADLARTCTGKESMDSLPAYDSNRSPSYEEAQSHSSALTTQQQRPAISRSWSTQFMISTSGLGAALNDTSLQSLKYCLTILTRANGHVRNLMDALRRLLSRYAESQSSYAESARRSEEGCGPDAMDIDRPSTATAAAAGDANQPAAPTASATGAIADEIRKLNHEIWQTFHNVVNYVSQYTGGALPENASTIVKWQLMSVPGRWQRAVRASQPQHETPSQPQSQPHDSQRASLDGERPDEPVVSSARRMLAFAIEGLDMMDQVGGVVDSTIVSAEKWLDSMGRRRREQQQYNRHGSLELPLPVQAQAQAQGLEKSG